jgi:hypothetical protein
MTSAINPNNIDGTYPVAGQDNNSQGFRDNFTNIKTNFQYAEDEITDLQNNAVLKSALSGTTLDNDMLGSGLSNAVLNDMGYSRLALGTTGGSVTINYAVGTYQTMTTNASTSLAFTNFPPAGVAGEVYFQITVASTAHTLTLPAVVSLGLTGIQGISGQVITFAATGTYNFRFTTNDGGTTVTVYDLNRPLNYYTNALTVVANTASTSTTTGALIISGGVGIAGNINIGGTGTFTGNVSGGNLNVTGNIVDTGAMALVTGASGNVSLAPNGTNTVIATTTGANVTGTLGVSGNITGGNISTAGGISTGTIVIASGAEDLAAGAAASLTLNASYFTTAAAETATLAAGTAGQIKTFAAVSITSGNMVITVTDAGWKSSGTGTITFDTIGDACTLQYINSKWFVIGNNGCTFA